MLKCCRFCLLSLILIAVLFACSGGEGQFTEQQGKGVQEEVTAVLHRYFQDVRHEGLGMELRYLDTSAAFYWMPPGYEETIGYDSVAALIRHNAAHTRVDSMQWAMLDVEPLSLERASYSARIHSVTWDYSAKKKTDIYFVESGLLVKRPDGWRLASGQTRILDRD